jgi:8-oxo-dGTP diphosphatase
MQKTFDKVVIRVYAIIIDKNRLLLSDEFWYDTPMTKLPGGGLEPGEGILNCLRRELLEELGSEPVKAEHLLTYDKLIASDFANATQVVPVYYVVQLADYSNIDASAFRFDFKRLENGAIRNRWIDLEKLDVEELTFIADREAISLLRRKEGLPDFIK